MSEVLTLLNNIRGSLGGDYATRIPEATRENILTVGNTILNYEPHRNAFFTQLLNRISKSVIKHVDELEDIYAVFKSEELPFGDTLQTIFIDVVEASDFEGINASNPASFIAPQKGSIHVEYMSVDRKLFYKVTVSIAELKEAFLTVDKLDEFVRQQIASMTRSYAVDRYIMTSWLLKKMASYVLTGYWSDGYKDSATSPVRDLNVNALVVPSSVAEYNPTTKEVEFTTTGAKDFLKLLRKKSRALKFYHKYDYYDVDDTDDKPDVGADLIAVGGAKTIKAIKTPVSKQVVALEVGTMAEIDVDALAVLFHMDKAEIEARMIELEDNVLGAPISADETTENDGYHIGGFICDRDAIVRCSSYEDSESFKNPEHLFINYWQHHWGFMAGSKFADFVPIVFSVKSEGE